MSSSVPQYLEELFLCEPKKGWVTLLAKQTYPLKGFGTQRVAKIMNGELQFTIGATELGQASKLNGFIRAAIKAEHIRVLERESTNGSRGTVGEYPSLSLNGANSEAVARIAQRVLAQVLESVPNARSN